MKKIFFPVLLALAIMATSCIKNEESEGVKSMRMSQASLLTAMAGATTTAATADAALKAAQAALTMAQADNQKAESAARVQQMTISNASATEQNRHTAAINALNESLEASRDAQTKASFTLQITEEAAQSAYKLKEIANSQTMLDAQIATDKINNDRALLDAKIALDQAQKDYDYGLQLQAKQYADNLIILKTQVQNELVSGYNSAYSTWSNQNLAINNINRSIISLGMRLNDRKTADSSDVNSSKRQMDGQKVEIDTLNAQLAKAKTVVTGNSSTGINTLIANYTAEKTTLEAAQSALSISKDIEYTDYRIAFDAYSKARDLYNGLSNKETAAESNVYYAESNVQAAKDGFEKTSGTFNIYTFNVTYGYVSSETTQFTAGLSHIKNGSYVGAVSIKDAVATEKGDTTTTTPTGVYLSLKDKEEVVLAQDAETAAKARIAEMQANYATVYDIWLAAHTAALTAQNQYKAAMAAYITASNKYNDWGSYSNQWFRNSNRINNLSQYISTLEYSSGQSYVIQLESDIKFTQYQLDNYYTPQYESALKSFNDQMPLYQVNYAGMQNNIDNLKASLANEQVKLALYKATLDEWIAKINAALPKN